jgi:hypothetical protein
MGVSAIQEQRESEELRLDYFYGNNMLMGANSYISDSAIDYERECMYSSSGRYGCKLIWNAHLVESPDHRREHESYIGQCG